MPHPHSLDSDQELRTLHWWHQTLEYRQLLGPQKLPGSSPEVTGLPHQTLLLPAGLTDRLQEALGETGKYLMNVDILQLPLSAGVSRHRFGFLTILLFSSSISPQVGAEGRGLIEVTEARKAGQAGGNQTASLRQGMTSNLLPAATVAGGTVLLVTDALILGTPSAGVRPWLTASLPAGSSCAFTVALCSHPRQNVLEMGFSDCLSSQPSYIWSAMSLEVFCCDCGY